MRYFTLVLLFTLVNTNVSAGTLTISGFEEPEKVTVKRITIEPLSGSRVYTMLGNDITINAANNVVLQDETLSWSIFNIGQDEKINFNQITSPAITLNHIVNGSTISIFGEISTTDQIQIINNNGVVFSDNAKIDVGGLTTGSTLTVKSSFAGGSISFRASPSLTVIAPPLNNIIFSGAHITANSTFTLGALPELTAIPLPATAWLFISALGLLPILSNKLSSI